MAEQILHAGPVSTFGDNPYKPSVVVGAGNQWDDADDATYATAWLSTRSTVDGNEYVYADLDAFAGSPSQVTAIRCVFRGSTQNLDGASGGRFVLELYDAASNVVVGFGGLETLLPSSGVVDMDIPLDAAILDEWGTTLATVATALVTGGRIYAYRLRVTGDPEPADYGFTVYELHIVVEYGTRRLSAPLRVVQRGNDGLGITGGRRAFGATSQQGSNRAFGFR